MDTVRQIYLAVAAFVLGCIVTEIRYIERIRKLRGLLDIYEDASKASGGPGPGDSWSDADASQSLMSLQQHLTDADERPTVPQSSKVDSPTVL
jgi:hypothetical protein